MNVIDCRYRPDTKEWMDTFIRNPVYAEYVRLTGFDRKPTRDLASCVRQLEQLGIKKALVTGRDIESTYASWHSNDLVDECVAAYPALFIGIYGYDPHKGMAAYTSMKRAFAKKKSLGASIEPGMAKCSIADPRYYPLYALCCDHDVPVLITAGLSPNMPGVTLEHSAPVHLDKVATDFPALRMLVSHGGYPWVNESIAVCMRHENIFMDFSSAANKPFGDLYIKAANEYLPERFVFASASPFADVDKALSQVLAMGFSENALENLLHRNARRLLKLDS
ncbi:amidohydrolase family protein [Desulfovibrio sp. OttesenSCG-928-O18]|nr:amidohydrolase family protein [Desulfovibrio sp. OttesenSCG-928-O18]